MEKEEMCLDMMIRPRQETGLVFFHSIHITNSHALRTKEPLTLKIN